MSQVACPYCSEEIPEDAAKCPECGELLDEGQAPAPSKMNPAVIVVIVLGVFLALCMIVGVIAAIAIPNLVDARKNGNEAAAIGALKTISTAETLFREADREQDGILDYGDIYELSQGQLIDQVLGSGMKQGYVFDAQPSAQTPEFLWMATADPIQPGTTGDRYFATNHEGVIYYSATAPIPINTDDCSLPADRLASGDIRPVGR